MSTSHLVLPPSNNHVNVRMVDTTALLAVPTGWLAEPVQEGHESINLTCVAFMIEHEPSGKKVMYDFGCRVDYWNYPDIVLKTVWKLKGLKIEKATSDVLKDCGVSLDSICKNTSRRVHPLFISRVVGPCCGFSECDV